MTRKPLPKAITRPLGELRTLNPEIAAGVMAPAANGETHHDQAEPEPPLAVSSAPIANDLTPAAPALSQKVAAKRRAQAQKIVARHRNYAAVGGLCPLPVANIAALTAINIRMVQQLSALYQVPFQRDRTRSFIVGLIGGVVPTGIGLATSSTLMWIIPGGLLAGLGASAVTAAALTRGIGLVFVESFESGAT
jgi:uncharacterized protein (DUF697 family)